MNKILVKRYKPKSGEHIQCAYCGENSITNKDVIMYNLTIIDGEISGVAYGCSTCYSGKNE